MQWRPLVGLDENLRGHAGNKLETFEVLELVLLDRCTNEVVGPIGLLLFPRQVRTNMRDLTDHVGDGSLISGHDADGRHCVRGDLVNVLRRNLGLDQELVGYWDDLHDGLATVDDAAHRMN